jgi:hypothetical protein
MLCLLCVVLTAVPAPRIAVDDGSLKYVEGRIAWVEPARLVVETEVGQLELRVANAAVFDDEEAVEAQQLVHVAHRWQTVRAWYRLDGGAIAAELQLDSKSTADRAPFPQSLRTRERYAEGTIVTLVEGEGLVLAAPAGRLAVRVARVEVVDADGKARSTASLTVGQKVAIVYRVADGAVASRVTIRR